MTRGATERELDKRHAFYTPLPWVLRCHMTMDKIFGLGWREQVVWDFACGDNNMTKWSPYEFRELYRSDVEKRYDTQPDFLYDATTIDEDKMPEGLRKAIVEQKPVILFTNIPFGVVGQRVLKNFVALKKKYNARFIWACISNGGFITHDRSGFCDNFFNVYMFAFPSTEFEGIKSKWPVFFTVWFSKRDGDPEFQYRQEQFPCLFVEVKK